MDPVATPLDQFVQAISGLLMLVATIAIGIVGDKLRGVLKDQRLAKAREVVLPGLTKAIEYAHARIVEGRVPTQEELLTNATNYAFDHFEDALKKLELTPENVRTMILARIGSPSPQQLSQAGDNTKPTMAPDPTVKTK